MTIIFLIHVLRSELGNPNKTISSTAGQVSSANEDLTEQDSWIQVSGMHLQKIDCRRSYNICAGDRFCLQIKFKNRHG